jgi:hypothetical protein
MKRIQVKLGRAGGRPQASTMYSIVFLRRLGIVLAPVLLSKVTSILVLANGS